MDTTNILLVYEPILALKIGEYVDPEIKFTL